jgi:hypothetical protein
LNRKWSAANSLLSFSSKAICRDFCLIQKPLIFQKSHLSQTLSRNWTAKTALSPFGRESQITLLNGRVEIQSASLKMEELWFEQELLTTFFPLKIFLKLVIWNSITSNWRTSCQTETAF